LVAFLEQEPQIAFFAPGFPLKSGLFTGFEFQLILAEKEYDTQKAMYLNLILYF
jgi:hypothetical protein